MNFHSIKSISLAAVLMAGSALNSHANLAVSFKEGAPKDRFVFTNVGKCDIKDMKLTVDLSGSKAGLIFDVTRNGAGVEVFQPFELVSGKGSVLDMPVVRDGDTKVDLRIDGLAPQKTIAFTIDVDDTSGGREITVSNSEIFGATIALKSSSKVYNASFTSGSKTVVELPECK